MRSGMIACLLLLANGAIAGEFSLGLAHSQHASETYRDGLIRRPYEDTHAFLGYHHSSGVDGYVFNNSHGDPAAAIGKLFAHQLFPRIQAEAFLGAAFGYKDDPQKMYAWVGMSSDMGYGVRLEVKVSHDVGFVGLGKRF